jgi:hypothetical protein
MNGIQSLPNSIDYTELHSWWENKSVFSLLVTNVVSFWAHFECVPEKSLI